jgi:hypothetical protein
MSRYNQDGQYLGQTISFGWDAPLRTFFLNVFQDDGEEEEVTNVVGYDYDQEKNLENFIMMVEEHGGFVTPEMKAELLADSQKPANPSPLQKQMEQFYKELTQC